MKGFALMLCLAPVAGRAADAPAETAAKIGLEKAAYGQIGLDQAYDAQAAAPQALPVDGSLGSAKSAARVNLAAQSPLSVKDAGAPPSPAMLNDARKGVEKAGSKASNFGFKAGFAAVFGVPMMAMLMVPIAGWIAAAILFAPLLIAGCVVGGLCSVLGAIF